MTNDHEIISEIILDAVTYSNISKHSPVINLHQLGYKTHIRLPLEQSVEAELYRIDEILPESVDDVCYRGFVIRECRKPWLDVLTEWLDTCQGHHIYKLSFVNIKTNYVFSLYVSYIIQEDHPKQDYVYMERDNEPNRS